MLLSELSGWDCAIPGGASNIEVTGVSSDTRTLRSGELFVALSGSKADGSCFILDAQSKGAPAILTSFDAMIPENFSIPVLRSKDPRRTLAFLSASFFPGQPETIVAVTGTSGKSSVSDFTRQIFEDCGYLSASLGTLGVVSPQRTIYGSMTTPDPVSLHRTLSELAQMGITHLAIEASSHGLEQRRLDAVKIKAAAFTNLGRDHLDYHPTIEHYFAAKMRLFKDLLPEASPAVLNVNGERAEDVRMVALKLGHPVFEVGRGGSDLDLSSLQKVGFTQLLQLKYKGRHFSVSLPLIGYYQVENALVAAGLALALGESAEIVLPALTKLRGVKGRLEVVGERNGGLAIVDYAHKPEALAAALDACLSFVSGKLICVFGCGGDRDKGKRPIMGEIASSKAQCVIVTDDNPRSENPASIRAEILSKAPYALEIGDRSEAIRHAVKLLGPGDVLIVAGKGHETGQIIGNTVRPFSDHDMIKEALQG